MNNLQSNNTNDLSSDEIVIKLKHVSKYYRLYSTPQDRLKESLNWSNKIYHKKFYATNDISLELKKGEVLGIIGRNGSGKSTLLKLITGVLRPDKGSIKINGKISALLELGSGFNPEFTGYNNIFFYGTILGFTKKDMEEKFDDIVAFADIGDFLYQPIKTYSSGMKARLGFAVAVHIDPEILILDEVLAVGDFVFRQKCLSKINEIRKTTSIIFVSHSMNDIRTFCDKAAVLKNGSIVYQGIPKNAISFYYKLEEKEKPSVPKKKKNNSSQKSYYGNLFQNNIKIVNIHHSWNSKHYSLGDEMVFEFSIELNYIPKNLIIGIPVWNDKENRVTSFNTDFQDLSISGKKIIYGKMKTICQFNSGVYLSILSILDSSEVIYRQLNDDFVVEKKERIFGYVTLDHDWHIS